MKRYYIYAIVDHNKAYPIGTIEGYHSLEHVEVDAIKHSWYHEFVFIETRNEWDEVIFARLFENGKQISYNDKCVILCRRDY